MCCDVPKSVMQVACINWNKKYRKEHVTCSSPNNGITNNHPHLHLPLPEVTASKSSGRWPCQPRAFIHSMELLPNHRIFGPIRLALFSSQQNYYQIIESLTQSDWHRSPLNGNTAKSQDLLPCQTCISHFALWYWAVMCENEILIEDESTWGTE